MAWIVVLLGLGAIFWLCGSDNWRVGCVAVVPAACSLVQFTLARLGVSPSLYGKVVMGAFLSIWLWAMTLRAARH